MRALAALSRFVGNTFAYWVLIFAVIAFVQPTWFLGLKSAIVPLLGLVMDSAHSFLQLFTSVVLFRLFMLIGGDADAR